MTSYSLHLSPDGKNTVNDSSTRLPVAESLKNMPKTAFKGMFSLQHIETNYEEITADIMHEIMNHFGTKRCNLFDEHGRWIK